jgi:hypothetical protein
VGGPSDERTGLSFVYAAGLCQRSLSRVRVPWDSRSYFTVSDLRLPFSSPPTTRGVTVEVFDPASTRVNPLAMTTVVGYSLYSHGADPSTENTSVAQQWIYANHLETASCDTFSIVAFTAPSHSNGSYPIVACVFVAAGMCLPSRRLQMGLHVTISNRGNIWRRICFRGVDSLGEEPPKSVLA